MEISFLGATKTVTGSNFLVDAGGYKFLVDCGMWQGKAEQEMENSQDFIYDPKQIDFVILTHAHIDHSGRIPKLFKDGFDGKVYAHKATCDLCSIMLPDSGHIQEQEATWKNKKRIRNGKTPIIPIYTAQDAINCLDSFVPLEYDVVYEINDKITIRLNDAGHMLGSAIIEIWEKQDDGEIQKCVFTGDLGNNDIPLLDNIHMIESADFLVMESTYGSRLHIRNDEKAKIFLDIVSQTLDNEGTVIIPSFAVGRTQEILYELNKLKENNADEKFLEKYKKLMASDVYVDSPLAVSATKIFKNNTYLFSDEIKEEILSGNNPLEFPGLHFTQSVDDSKMLNERQEPAIIISASGMCEIGRIKHHLKHNLWNEKSTILFVGYQAPGTLGYSIVNGAKKVKIFGEEIQVNARVEYIEGYSGHADQTGLLNFVYSIYNRPKCIFLVHREENSQITLKQKLEEQLDTKVIIPEFGQTYKLDKECEELAILVKEIKRCASDNMRQKVLNRLANVKLEIKDMEMAIESDVNNKELTNRDIYRINEKIKELEKQILNIIEG